MTIPAAFEPREEITVSVPPEQMPSIQMTGEATAPIDPSVVQERALKYHFALDRESPGPEELARSLAMGEEDKQRQYYASKQALQDERTKQQMIYEYMSNTPNPTKEDVEMIRAITSPEMAALRNDPKTFFEKKLAERVINQTVARAAQTSEDHDILYNGENAIAVGQVISRLREDYEAKWNHAGWGRTVVEHTENFIPFLSWSRQSSALKGVKTEGWLLGNNLEDQARNIRLLPVSQAAAILEETVKRMYEQNPPTAISYLRALEGFTSNTQTMGNIGSMLDTAFPAAGLVGVAGTVNIAKAAWDVTRAITGRISIPTVLTASGANADAALSLAWRKLQEQATSVNQNWDFEKLRGGLFAITNPDQIVSGAASSVTTEAANRLTNIWQTNAAKLVQGLDNPDITRIQPDTAAYTKLIDETRKLIDEKWPQAKDHIMDVRPVVAQETLGNVDKLAIDWAKKDGAFFDTALDAENFAKHVIGLKGGYKVEQQGLGYYIRSFVGVDETNPLVRSALIETANETPKSFKNIFLGLLRSPDDLLPNDLVSDLKTASYGISQMITLAKGVVKEIGKLPKESRARFQDFLERDRDFIDPVTKQRGTFAQTIGEFETKWHAAYKTMPTEKEIESYFSYVQLNQVDYFMRNLGLYRDKHRMGIEMFNFPYTGATIKDAFIEGKFHGKFPWEKTEAIRDYDAGVLVFDANNPAASQFQALKFWTKRDRTLPDGTVVRGLDDLVDEGYKVIQLSKFGDQALKQMPWRTGPLGDVLNKGAPLNGRIHYALVKEFESKPLPFQHLPNRPGGHVDYETGLLLKQPVVEKRGGSDPKFPIHDYYGDKTILGFTRLADAKHWQEHFNAARLLLKDDARLNAYIKQHFAGLFSTAGFKRLFDPKGELKLDPDTAIEIVPKGSNAATSSKLADRYTNFRDASENPHDLYSSGINLKFAGERDDALFSIANKGTSANPAYNFVPAKLINPMQVADNAAAQLMKGKYIDDLKFKTAEHFVQEFKDILRTPLDVMRRDPFKVLMEPDWAKGVDLERLAAAKNFRRSALGFMGLENEYQQTYKWLTQKTADLIYDRLGATGLSKAEAAIDIADKYTLGFVKDPLTSLRSFAFHTKLGLFNPVQLFLQAQTFTHILALEGPDRASKALGAATYMRWMLHADQHMGTASKMAKGWGYKSAKDFNESFEGLRSTGFHIVGGEYAVVDDFIDPKIIQSGIQRALESGRIFFNEGERSVRLAAWNASYLRWREANPTAAFNDKAIKEVLARADLLTVNMSRASSAAWQRGLLAPATQFFGYQTRLMEQVLGKRLTPSEKMSAFATYGLMYGLPVAAGVWVGGIWPAHESIRKYALEKGIDTNDTVIGKLLNDGIPSMLLELATGTQFNYADRLGPGGLPWLKDIAYGRKGILETLVGVSGSVAKDTAFALDPLAMSIASIFKGDNEFYPLTVRDFSDALSNASSYNAARNLWNALTVGQYLTKNEVIAHDITGFQGLMNALLGVVPQSFDDMYTKIESGVDLAAMQKDEKKKIIKYLRLAIKTDSDKDRMDYLRRAKTHFVLGRFNPSQVSQINAEAMKGYESEMLRVGEQFARQSPERLEAWIKELKRIQN